MSLRAFLYDDPADAQRFLPFTDSRPIGELRYGAWLIRERAARLLGAVEGHVAAPHLAGFVEPEAPPVVTPDAKGTRLFLRSSFVLDANAALAKELAGGARPKAVRLVDASGATVGCVLADGAPWPGADAIPEGWPAQTVLGRRLIGAWLLVGDLLPVLRADLEAEARSRETTRVPASSTVIGDATQLMVDEGATVEPLVVFDLRGGPIWIQAGAEIRSFTRLAGPLLVGRGTRIVGGQLRESSIGPRCVVHGEVSNCLFLGYANKSHDGFLGHSIVGRWVNLGAGTITSNLKNTYGPVRLDLGAERVETGMTFLGTLFGDHVKTAIGTMLPTGAVLGTGANVFGTRRPAGRVHPFAWGTDEAGRITAGRMFLQTASRVLPRRDVAFDAATQAWLSAVYTHATGRPCD